MPLLNQTFHRYILVLCILFLSSCGSQETKRATLRDIDLSNNKIVQTDATIAPKTESEIKQAYYQYLQNAAKDDSSRQAAINRLAQMELDLTNKLIKDSQNDEIQQDLLYNQTLQKTINLLTTSLKDFPKAKGNDTLLYQLARTYDQIGEHTKAINALTQLVREYRNSTYYPEAQFRIGEAAFITGNYITAEDAYTEVITSPDSDRFYEKAFFKRGWTRYKQELYIESVDDYLESLTLHKFDEYSQLEKSEKEQFDEYFRAIGLSFSHLNGAESLRTYFVSNSNFLYIYHTYSVIADIYLKQERYSDAATTMIQFVQHHPESKHVPSAKLKIIETWQEGGFVNHVHASIEELYALYRPDAVYWKTHNSPELFKTSQETLREYIVKEASFFHSEYQKNQKQENFTIASTWYKRYLSHYSSYAQKDGFYNLYAQLLYAEKEYIQALKYFELAAYDGNIILNKEAAYASITLSNHLYVQTKSDERRALLKKLTHYTGLYVELYPEDDRSISIALNAAQLSFNDKNYKQAIRLTEALPSTLKPKDFYTANIIKARAYFETENFSDAESTYQTLHTSTSLSKAKREESADNLALSIYRQGEIAVKENDIDQATRHYIRISDITPRSEIASTALYDAIALAMQYESWANAIDFIGRFKELYPRHKLDNDVTKKLSIAYLKSNQGDKAAREFERISSFEQDEDIKMAALWQAAALYESKNDTEAAIRSYRNYANTYKKPYPQYMEAMYKLSYLYKSQNEQQKRFFWQSKLAAAGRRATESEKTDRTIFIAATATLNLAQQSHEKYRKVHLIEPLKNNLRKKKTLMQETIKLYGNASAFGLAEITTESTFSIGSIYQDFSIALLNSERPKNLSADELDQYEILLEDQAFPFEDKAIEFYETNISRSKEGIYNAWLAESRMKLTELFPARYSRAGKVMGYINHEK